MRSTEQRYKKKSNYKRRTPDCVFLCRESAATAPPYNEMGSSSQFVCKVTKSRNNRKSQSQKLFLLIKIHSNDTPTLHADSYQKLVYYLAKTETFSTKLHGFIHRLPIRPHFLLAPGLFCPSTRVYAHSANFHFLPSPFTTRDLSLILGELGVKAMPSNAFTRLKSFLLTRRGRKNTVNEGLVFRFWLPSPLSSPSTPCISIQYRASTLYFEVKEIKRTFTLFGHLSH